MTERLSSTTHGDAPLSAAYEPDASAAALWGTEEGDELIARTMTIDRPLDELREFLRQPANLRLLLADESLELDWDHVVLDDGPVEPDGYAIAWHSAPGAKKRFSGRIDLVTAPADRGIEVTFTLAFEARSAIGKLVNKLTQHDPRIQSRRALRRFKQLLETGEISTSEPGRAAPRAS